MRECDRRERAGMRVGGVHMSEHVVRECGGSTVRWGGGRDGDERGCGWGVNQHGG